MITNEQCSSDVYKNTMCKYGGLYICEMLNEYTAYMTTGITVLFTYVRNYISIYVKTLHYGLNMVATYCWLV